MTRLIAPALVLICFVAAPLSAQTDQTGVLEGKVQDVAGGAIAQADVRMDDSAATDSTKSGGGLVRLTPIRLNL